VCPHAGSRIIRWRVISFFLSFYLQPKPRKVLKFFSEKTRVPTSTDKTTHNYESNIYTLKQRRYEIFWRDWFLESATPSGCSPAVVAARAAGAAEVTGVARVGRPGARAVAAPVPIVHLLVSAAAEMTGWAGWRICVASYHTRGCP
jgi:hypothetical protein